MPRATRITIRLGACLAAFALALSLAPSTLWADIRASDQICGISVSDRGLASRYCPNISCEASIVMDGAGEVYFERNADEQRHIASITKVMTALVALDYGDPETTMITVSETAGAIGESSAMLQAGDTLTLEQALKAMLICSGNDAAQAISESMGDAVRDALKGQGDASVPEDGYEAFVYAMNKKAAELGMENSLFANPHGLDIDEFDQEMYSSARDVALMCRAALENELFKQIVSTSAESIPVTRDGAVAQVELESTDELLGTYEGACGVKTGFTEEAGACFAGATERDGDLVICIVLDATDESVRFTDASTLADWYYEYRVDYPLAHSSEETTYTAEDGQDLTVPVAAYVAHADWLDKTFKATLADPEAIVSTFALEGNISQEVSYDVVTGDVEPGQKVGTVTFYQHNEVVATQDLVAAESCAAPGLLEGLGIWWQRLLNELSGKADTASSHLVNETPLIYGPNATVSSSTASQS